MKYEESAFKGDPCRWMMGKLWLPEMEGYRMLLLNIDVRRVLDGKHKSKLADKVSIDLRQNFYGFIINAIGVAVFCSKVNVRQCF